MKKIRKQLSLIMLLILSFVVMVGAAASMLASADTRQNGEPAAVEVYSDDWYEITITEDSLTVLLNAEIGSYRSISRDDLTNIKNAAIKAVKTLVVEKILNGTSEYSAKSAKAISAAMPIAADDLSSISQRYRDYLKDRLSTVEEDGYAVELDKFLHGEYDALIEYAASRYVSEGHGDENLEELVAKVQEEISAIVNEVLQEFAEDDREIWISDPNGNGVLEVTDATISDVLEAVDSKLGEVGGQVVNNGGQMSLSFTKLLEMIKGVKIGGIEVYNGDKFVLSGIKQLISTLPSPAEIASWSDDEMNLSYDIAIGTSLGDVDFNLTVGLKGDASYIRKAAQFIADHFSAYNDNGVYTVEVNVSEAFSAVLLKLSETDKIPDGIKHAVFGLFQKTGDEIFDKASGYSYDQIMSYLKGKDFHSLFSGMMDAQRIRDYFKGYNVDLSKLTDENIDRLINGILKYAEKVANNETVEGVEEFLQRFGIPGIPAQLEGAVQKFLNLLNKIDYKYWNATTIREFLSDGSRVNAKIDAALTRLANSAKAEKLYNLLVEYAERLFNQLPNAIHNSTVIDFYNGNGEMAWAGDIDFNVKEVLTKIINKLIPYAERAGVESASEYAKYVDGIIDSYFEGDMNVNVSVSLNVNLAKIYKVEYVANDEVVGAGLLPTGADVVFYANMTEVNGQKIVAWVDEDGNEYEEMPAKDVTLYAVTEFEAYIAENEVEVTEVIQKVYDGEPIVLTVEIVGAAGANPKFTWFKDGELYAEKVGMEGATLELVNVADSGIYYCIVTNSNYEWLTAETQEVEIIIEKAPLNLTVSVEDWMYGEDANEPVIEGNLGEGEVAYVYEGVDGTEYAPSANAPQKAGSYKLTIIVAETDNYLSGEAECEFTITKAEVTVEIAPEEAVYNGEDQRPEITVTGVNETVLVEGVDYEVTYTVGGVETEEVINVGEYTVTITLLGDAATNYEAPETYTFTITKAPLELTVSVEDWTYGEDANEPVIEGNLGEGEVTYVYEGVDGTEYGPSADAPENAGSYKLTITVAETDNYQEGTAHCTFTVEKAELELELTIEGWTYGEDANVPVLTGNVENGEETYLYEGNGYSGAEAPKNAGEYTVTVTVEATENYNGGTASCTFTIAKATLDLRGYWDEGDGSLVYDGTEKQISFCFGDDYYLPGDYYLPEDVEIEVFGNKGVNAGEYKAYLVLTYDENNYTVKLPSIGYDKDHAYPWMIEQATLEVEVYPASNEYNGEVQLPTVVVTGVKGLILEAGEDYEVSYTLKGEAATPANVGVYKVIIELKGLAANNYYAITEELSYEITAVELEVVVTPATNVYNNAEQKPEITVTGINNTVLVEGEDYKVTYMLNGVEVDEVKNAGVYAVVITLLGDNAINYVTPEASSYEITKATIDLSGYWDETAETSVYDGAEKLVIFRFGNDNELPDVPGLPEDVNIEVFGYKGVDAGEYRAYFVLTYDENNYTVKLPTVGYDEEHAYIWVIEQAILTIDGIEFVGETEFTFDGKVHSVSYQFVEGIEFPDLVQFESIGTWSEMNAGEYTATLRISTTNKNYKIDEDNNTVSISWVIKAVFIDLSDYSAHWDLPSKAIPFDGNKHVVDLLLAEGYTIDGLAEELLVAGYSFGLFENNESEVGTYNPYVKVVDATGAITNNYVVIGVIEGVWSIVSDIQIDLSAYHWSITEVVYNGTAYTVKLVDADGKELDLEGFDLPEGYTLAYGENEYTAAGVYYAYIAVFYNGAVSQSYNIVLEDNPHKWTVKQATVNDVVVSLEIKQGDETVASPVYNGVNYVAGVTYNYDINEYFTATVEGDSLTQMNAGEYTVTVTLAPKFDTNYIYNGQTEITLTWSIAKAVAKVESAPALSASTFTYDGTAHTVEVNYTVTPATAFKVTVGGDALTQTNAGVYTVTVTVEFLDTVNYSYEGENEYTLTWSIAKAVAKVESAPALSANAFTYDGTAHTVEVNYAVTPATAFKVTVGGDALTQTNAGVYTVTVTVEFLDTVNYSYEGENEYTLTWSIAKAEIELSAEPHLVTDSFDYNGAEHTVEVDYTSVPAEAFDVTVSGATSAKNAGTYYVTVTIALKEEYKANYNYAGKTAFTLSWSIAPKAIGAITGEWKLDNEDGTTVKFNGAKHSVSFVPENISVEDFIIYYEGTYEAVNAGTYTAKVVILSRDGNYSLGDDLGIAEITWTITPATVDLTGAAWDNTARTYNGSEQSVTLNNLPDLSYLAAGYELKYYGNVGTNAGTYYAHVAIVKDGELTVNYVITGLTAGTSADSTYKWSIAKKALDITVAWSSETNFVYDGNQHGVTLEVTGADADKVEVGSINNAFTNAGVYTAIARLTLKAEYAINYLENNTSYATSWEIAKKEITVSAKWSDSAESEYDGREHGVLLSVTGEYASYVTVSYAGVNTAIEVGNYTAIAKLTLKAEYSNNYTLAETEYSINWKIKPAVVPEVKSEFEATGGDLPEGVKITVSASKPLPADSELQVSATSPNSYSDEDFKPFVAAGTIPSLVHVYAISITNIPAGYDGTFTVTISNSEFGGKDLIVVHIPLNADGTPVDKEDWSNTDANLSGDNLTFATPGFSDFAVVEQLRANDSLWLLWVMLAIIIILLIVIIILIVLLLRKKKAPEEVETHPVVIIKTVEKEVEKEVVKEVPVAASEEDESAVALVEAAPEETEEEVPLIAEDGSRIIYDKSFRARLSQADNTLKDYYAEIKNYILSYSGVKSRVSWHFDSFNKGREKCIKLQFRGKSLYMYINLSSEGLPEKYRTHDVGEKSRYEDVPTMLKIRKPRSIKYAKQLVDMLMANLGAVQGEIPTEKYRTRYRSTKSLIDMGLIKVKTTKSTFAAPKPKKSEEE